MASTRAGPISVAAGPSLTKAVQGAIFLLQESPPKWTFSGLALVERLERLPKKEKRSHQVPLVPRLGAAVDAVPQPLLPGQNSLLLWAGESVHNYPLNHPKSVKYEHTHPDSSLSVSRSRGS